MKMTIKTVSFLAVLMFLTLPALGAYDAKNDHTTISASKPKAPIAKLDIFCLQGKDVVYTNRIQSHVTQDRTTVMFIDNSKGQVLWKKWYVDGKLVSTSTDPYIYYEFKLDKKANQFKYFTVTLKVANYGGKTTDSKVVTVTRWDPNIGKP